MAKKRPVPLKDEQQYTIDDLYTKLQAIEDVVKSMNQESDESLGNSGNSSNQMPFFDAEQFTMSVATAMDSYLKAHQNKVVVEGEKPMAKQVEAVLEKYNKALLLLQKQSQYSQEDRSLAQPSPIHEGFAAPSGITKPKKPTTWKETIVYWLCFLPWFHIRAFFASRYIRWWFRTILFCVWLTSLFLTCIIATDNAKMHKVQEKYVLLREFAKPNREWADKADYIEFLYSDEEEHQKDIEMLWEMRRKRLGR